MLERAPEALLAAKIRTATVRTDWSDQFGMRGTCPRSQYRETVPSPITREPLRLLSIYAKSPIHSLTCSERFTA